MAVNAATAIPRRLRPRRGVQKAAIYAFITLWLLLTIFPFYWIVSSSLKTHTELYRAKQTFFPHLVTFENYIKLIVDMNYFFYYMNSVIVTSAAMVVGVGVSYFAAYSLIRMRYPGRRFLGRIVLFSYLVPASLLVIPLYVIMDKINLIDTFTGLILAYCSGTIPFSTWLLMGYFKSVPQDLEEAALIDGCNRLGVMGRILLPLVFPGIVTAMIYNFVAAWNVLLYPLVFISSESRTLLPVVLAHFVVGDSQFNWGVMMAAAALMTIPPVVFFVFLQRYVMQGLTEGAVKG